MFTLGEFVRLLNAVDDRIKSRCSVGRVCDSEDEEEEFQREKTKKEPRRNDLKDQRGTFKETMEEKIHLFSLGGGNISQAKRGGSHVSTVAQKAELSVLSV